MSKLRGTGITSAQIKAAPNGATFVWCNEYTAYAKYVAARLGRQDVMVVSPSWLHASRINAGNAQRIVIDHAFSPQTVDCRLAIQRLAEFKRHSTEH